MEESIGPTLFFELCRLCLKNPGESGIFDDEERPNDIFLCTGVRVLSIDTLPQKICNKCLNVINSSKELRNLASSNNSHLHTLFGDDSGTPEQIQCHVDVLSASPEHEECSSTVSGPSNQNTGPKINIRKDLFSESNKANEPSSSSEKRTRRSLLKSDSSESNNSSSSASSNLLEKPLKSKGKKAKSKNVQTHFPCETCYKVFDKPKKLYHHQRLHNRQFPCPLDACGKSFASRGDLEKHVRVHTGERPFACGFCDRRFGQRGTCRQHERTVHPDRFVAS